MHNFVFQGGGVGGVGGLFSGILRCEFNRFEFNKFPPPPPQQSHTWPMKLTATWTFCNSLSDVVGSSLCDFKIISKQPAVFCFYMTGGCLTTPGRVMYGDVVMWNTDKVFNCPLPQPVIKQCFLKSTCKITFHESFMAWFTFF